MASNHHQCHCHPTPPTPTYYYHQPTTTCYCTTTHHPSVHSISSHHHLHAPPQPHLHAPPQPHLHAPPPPPHQIQQKHHQHENVEENPTVTSLIHRISALETTLRRRNNNQFSRSSSLRHTAARTIQTHFRAFLVQRSVTLRHLKDLAYIKSALNHLKSSVSNKTHFDSYFISKQSMNLLIKLDSIQGSDPMIRDGKRSISRELIRFMELIEQISVKTVRISKIRASGSRVFGANERKLVEDLEKRISKIRVSKTEEDENPRKPGGLSKSQLKVKKNVSFDENENVYRIIKSNRDLVISDGSESSNGDDEEVEETEVVEEEEEEVDSSEMSEIEMDSRKSLGTRINHLIQKNQHEQEVDEDVEDEEVEDDSFVFSAPLAAKMEYRVDAVNKKQTSKH